LDFSDCNLSPLTAPLRGRLAGQACKVLFNRGTLRFSETCHGRARIMSGGSEVLSPKEFGLFNQVALFCGAGLSMSLSLVLAYDVQIAWPWF
jgi:hypothetical protein